MLVDAVHDRTGLRATAGAGPNLFLSKVTADILAERPPDGVGVLDEDRFMRDVRFHRPLTDIWGIGPDIARRLERHGARDLAGIAAMRLAALYREFGANAERLIDHAWGREPCTIAQIQGHRPAGSSLSNGRVLDRGYGFDEVEALLREMALESGLELLERGLAAGSVSLHVGYEHPRRERAEGFGPFEGPCGAEEPEPTAPPGSTGARSGFDFATSSPRELADRIVKLHRATTRRDLPVRRVCLGFSDLATDGEEHRPWVLRDSSERRGERGARPAWVNPARARQFMAFAALKGYADMVSELALGRSEP